MGAAKVNLWGVSYGTNLALAVIKRHEKLVNRAILNGVEGPDEVMLKLPSTIQQQLIKLDNLIKGDAKLNKLLPDFLHLTENLLNQLGKKPVTAQAPDPQTKQKINVTVGKWDFQFFTAGPLN